MKEKSYRITWLDEARPATELRALAVWEGDTAWELWVAAPPDGYPFHEHVTFRAEKRDVARVKKL